MIRLTTYALCRTWRCLLETSEVAVDIHYARPWAADTGMASGIFTARNGSCRSRNRVLPSRTSQT
jgi:hypothetical protein